jgi:mannose-6-phosphate isomerase-like protein (cupin superfamily)
MTRAGDVFENPATRETGRIITGADDTDGRYMRSETRLRPGGAVSVAHRHPGCTERFEVLEGELTVQLEGRARTLAVGEHVTIAPGAAHHYANRSQQDVVFRFDVWPAARFEAMVVTLFALGMEGKTNAKGAPSPLQLAVILDEYRDVMELVGPPRWLQRMALPLLARVGRARGLRAAYPHHDNVYAGWQQQAKPALGTTHTQGKIAIRIG